jgi:RNA polymerase sigma-70 factor (ECF subfamily)
MVAAQGGERKAYDQLFRELDAWLRRYYARRLPSPASDDARQDALLAIYANRHTYAPSRPFGRWVAAIARYKWIDHLRDATRFATSSLDDEISVEQRAEPAMGAITVGELLRHLKPAQAHVVRLVKLQGLSIAVASSESGQSTALVKVNIHRGLKKLAALAASDAATLTKPSIPRSSSSNRCRSESSAGHQLRHDC